MYTKLEISHFRAFSSLTVAPLKRINLIAGDNNIGKTGILEAIYLAHADYNAISAFPSLFRRPQFQLQESDRDLTDNFWLWIFHKRNLEQAWTLSLSDGSNDLRRMVGRLVTGDGNREVPFESGMALAAAQMRISTSVGSNKGEDAWYTFANGLRSNRGGPLKYPHVVTAFSTRFDPPSEEAELINAISVLNEDEELVSYLQLVEPRLKKLKYLKLPGHRFPYVYADIGFGRGKDLIPATQLGQGFARVLSLFATIMVKKPRILLIDEVENGLQHDALVPIWRSVFSLARHRDIQIFATTHSYECIGAAHEAAGEGQDYDLGVIKLRRDATNEVEAVVMDQGMIGTALERNLEVR